MPSSPGLLHFLEAELGLTCQAIETAQSLSQEVVGPLPMVLWQSGLIFLLQLEQVFDWQEQQYSVVDSLDHLRSTQ
jgi:hypothetical protein